MCIFRVLWMNLCLVRIAKRKRPKWNGLWNAQQLLKSYSFVLLQYWPYADYQKKFIVHTDASDSGLGAVLYHFDGKGNKRVITYVSRSLSSSEKNYLAHKKLEFLALKWPVTNRFHEYLYRGEFKVYTDTNPLTYVLTMANLDATGQQWIT